MFQYYIRRQHYLVASVALFLKILHFIMTQIIIVGIQSLRIRHGGWIDAIQAEYILADGTMFLGSRNGGPGGGETTIMFLAGEVITGVNGTTGAQFVYQLTFITTDGNDTTRIHGPFGIFTGPNPLNQRTGGYVVAFHGRASYSLNAIGFYSIG